MTLAGEPYEPHALQILSDLIQWSALATISSPPGLFSFSDSVTSNLWRSELCMNRSETREAPFQLLRFMVPKLVEADQWTRDTRDLLFQILCNLRRNFLQ
jgi:hypothetical protein